ncbi:hypothetical protein [Colwellia sp. BRX10-4]|nr:hypothetical protein [Colwellia sp. BRX10-4]MBA6397613.1 hypothetical protein [Colwellia sp. BRX10-4]
MNKFSKRLLITLLVSFGSVSMAAYAVEKELECHKMKDGTFLCQDKVEK